MRRSIEEYDRKCDPCQKIKENREFVAPLGEVETHTPLFRWREWIRQD